MPIKILIRRTGAETGHADETPFRADNRIPALADAGFDRDVDFRGADGGQANNSSKHGTETIRARMPRAARSLRASTASISSEPEANSDTCAAPPSAAI